MSPGLVIDLFAGGGGASTGLEAALGRPVDVARFASLVAGGGICWTWTGDRQKRADGSLSYGVFCVGKRRFLAHRRPGVLDEAATGRRLVHASCEPLQHLPGPGQVEEGPVKQSEIAPCVVCGRKLMENRSITWWHVTIVQEVADLGAIRRQTGLEMMLGPLARHMGPDEDIAKATPPRSGRICQTCVCDSRVSLGALVESMPALEAEESV